MSASRLKPVGDGLADGQRTGQARALDPEQVHEPRQAVLLSYLEGLTHMELAERMQRPLGTVKAWTRRSLLALRQCLAGGTA